VTTERLGDKTPIFHRIVANLGGRDVDNRAFDEFYLSLRIIAIELGHVLWLSNIEGNLFRIIRIFRDKLFDTINPRYPSLGIGWYPSLIQFIHND